MDSNSCVSQMSKLRIKVSLLQSRKAGNWHCAHTYLPLPMSSQIWAEQGSGAQVRVKWRSQSHLSGEVSAGKWEPRQGQRPLAVNIQWPYIEWLLLERLPGYKGIPRWGRLISFIQQTPSEDGFCAGRQGHWLKSNVQNSDLGCDGGSPEAPLNPSWLVICQEV